MTEVRPVLLNADAEAEKRYAIPLPNVHNPVLTRRLVNETIQATSTTVSSGTSTTSWTLRSSSNGVAA